VLWGANCAADEDLAARIGRVAHATRTLNYEGTFIYAHGASIDAMRIVHAANGGEEHERLVSLTGPGREVIRDGARITCTFADDRAVMVEKYRPADYIGLALSEPVEKIATQYAFESLGRERIAGREALAVVIRPRAADRYGYRLSIDKQTNLPLKSAVLAGNGAVLEQVMFVSLNVGQPIAPEKLTAELDGAGYTYYRNEAAAPAAAAPSEQLGVGWLPSGFSLKKSHLQHLSTSRAPVTHLVFSDGLAMVSVFVEKLMDDVQPLNGYSAMGAVNAFSRMSDRFQITVVGEIPQTTVRRIAASVAIAAMP
jgi:sigma-E factor negative regulatory protein RseB